MLFEKDRCLSFYQDDAVQVTQGRLQRGLDSSRRGTKKSDLKSDHANHTVDIE